jgi:hypothetical protein
MFDFIRVDFDFFTVFIVYVEVVFLFVFLRFRILDPPISAMNRCRVVDQNVLFKLTTSGRFCRTAFFESPVDNRGKAIKFL